MIAIPTLKEIYDDILASLEAEFGVTIPLVGKNFLRALAAVQAGKLWIFYKIVGDVQKNIFADTADPVSMGGTLERFGLVKLGRNPNPAVAAKYNVTVTGSNGAVIQGGQTFKSDDSSLNPGIMFVLDNTFTLSGTSGVIVLRALTGGLVSELNVLNTLTATSPIALVNSTATVYSENLAPSDAETTEEYRAKTLEAYRLEPQGGSGSDYRLWSNEVGAVKTAYPYAKSGVTAEINLFVESKIADSFDGRGTPTSATLLDVKASVEDPTVDRPGRKPLGVYAVNYIGITPLDVDIMYTGFVGLTAEVETIITDYLTTYMSTVRPFVASIDILSAKNDILNINKLIYQTQLANPASVFDEIFLSVNGINVTSYQFENGDIPYLNSVTFY